MDGRVLPWFELMLGILLIIGVGLRWTSLISSGLLLVSSRHLPAPNSRPANQLRLLQHNEPAGTATLVRRQQHAHSGSRNHSRRISNQETQGHCFLLIFAFSTHLG